MDLMSYKRPGNINKVFCYGSSSPAYNRKEFITKTVETDNYLYSNVDPDFVKGTY